MRNALLTLSLLLAQPVWADSWQISLGGRALGTLKATPGALSAVLDNTPLGAGDGTFEARIAGGLYRATSRSTSDSRQIDIRFEGGQAIRTIVTPDSERTALSDPALAPTPVLDPVTGFAQLANARDCAQPFAMYDGRRAISVTPTARVVGETRLTCRFAYNVVGGPGHISPFRLTKLRLEATYPLSNGKVTGMARLIIRAGPFAVTLAR